MRIGGCSAEFGYCFLLRRGEDMTLNEYFREFYEKDLLSIGSQYVNDVLRERFGNIKTLAPEDIAANLEGLASELPPYFVMVWFTDVLIDQHTYTSYREHYPTPDRTPFQLKLGRAGLGLHNERPQRILKEALNSTYLGSDYLLEKREEFAEFISAKARELARILGIDGNDFLLTLRDDPDWQDPMNNDCLKQILPLLRDALH